MLELRALSRPRVTLDGEAVTGFISDKALALLFYLALHEGRRARKQLAGLLWGELPEKRARGNLRVALHNLKQLLPGYLDVSRKFIAFVHEQPRWIDVHAFTGGAQAGDPQALAEAIDLYAGDFLAGLYVDGAPELADWLRAERERLRLRLIGALERLAGRYRAVRAWPEAERALRRLLAVEPWREQTHRELMLVLARQGKYAAALAQYETCRRVLADELDVAPMPQTERLYERVRRLRTAPRHNLPATTNRLIGREAALRQLTRRLARPSCRLLTLHGPGGAGKTRLALALAARLSDRFLEGVFYVPLSDVEAPRRVPLAVAEAMRLSLTGPQSFAAQLFRQLDGRELLLVFDNVEQLPEAVPFMQRLLAAVPGAKIVAGSRVVLHTPGEWTHAVEGLAVPEGDGDPAAAPAVQLFLQQARHRQHFLAEPPDLQAVAEICRLVEGLPLAIEQAANWLRVLDCRSLLAELQAGILFRGAAAAPRPGRGMAAALEQSWQLLDDAERAAFSSLSIFRGGFTRAAATAVAGVPLPVLARLVDHALLRCDEDTGRCQIHELLRQFGAEKLAGDVDRQAALLDRHAGHFAGFMGRRADALYGPEQQEHIAAILPELENIGIAWTHALREIDVERIRSFVRSFWYVYELQGWYREGLQVYADARRALASARAANRRDSRFQSLWGEIISYYAWFLFRAGGYVEADRLLAEGIALIREHGSEKSLCWPLFCRGFCNLLMGDYPAARNLLAECERVSEKVGNDAAWFLGSSVQIFLALATGTRPPDQEIMERYRRTADKVGGARFVSNILYLQGLCALARGEFDKAEAYIRDALAVSSDGGDKWNVALCHNYLGQVALARQDWEGARRWLEAGLAQMEALGEELGITFCRLGLGWTELGQGRLAEARDHFTTAHTIAVTLRVRPQELEARAGLAACELAAGEAEQATALLTAVIADPATAHPVRLRARMLLGESAAA